MIIERNGFAGSERYCRKDAAVSEPHTAFANLSVFLSPVSTAVMTRHIDTASLSVCLSVTLQYCVETA